MPGAPSIRPPGPADLPAPNDLVREAQLPIALLTETAADHIPRLGCEATERVISRAP